MPLCGGVGGGTGLWPLPWRNDRGAGRDIERQGEARRDPETARERQIKRGRERQRGPGGTNWARDSVYERRVHQATVRWAIETGEDGGHRGWGQSQ